MFTFCVLVIIHEKVIDVEKEATKNSSFDSSLWPLTRVLSDSFSTSAIFLCIHLYIFVITLKTLRYLCCFEATNSL